MKALAYTAGLTALACMLAGCEPPPVPVQPVTIISSDLCEIVDKKRDLSWSVNDTRETITNLRRLGAKHDSRCAKSKPSS